MKNPFQYPGPVTLNQFVNRENELQEVVERISSRQSTLLIGEPRIGKTSFLNLFDNHEFLLSRVGTDLGPWIVSTLNGQIFSTETTLSRFWKTVLNHFVETIVTPDRYSAIAKAYRVCDRNNFESQDVSSLFSICRKEGLNFLFLFDEFDALLGHPHLNSAAFYGSLRTLSQNGLITLVLASATPQSELEDLTASLKVRGSPFFNTYKSVILSPFSREAAYQILNMAGDRFSAGERSLLYHITGGHPYLVQVGASELWKLYEQMANQPARARQTMMLTNLLREAGDTIEASWRYWSAGKRLAYIYVAFQDIQRQFSDNRFREKQLFKDTANLKPALRELANQGFIVEDKTTSVGWRIGNQVFLWWLADEITRLRSEEIVLNELLRSHHVPAHLSNHEKAMLISLLKEVKDVLKDGVNTLIKTIVENYAKRPDLPPVPAPSYVVDSNKQNL